MQEPQYYSCEVCDSLIDPSTWTPLDGEYEDGDYEIYRFCSESCRQEWRADD